MRLRPILWIYDPQKDGKFPVKICITRTSNGKTTRNHFKMDFSVKESEWDEKAGRVKTKHPNAVEMNLKISEALHNIEKNDLTGSTGIAALTSDQTSFYWWFQERINLAKEKHSAYHWKKQNTSLMKLKEFAPNLLIHQVNHRFLSSYEVYLLKKGHHKNYVADLLVRIRCVTNDMLIAKAIHDNPFQNFKITEVRSERKRLDFVEFAEMKSLAIPQSTHGRDHDSVRLAMSMFIFSFYTGGIRFGDMCRLKWSMIKDGRLRFIMHKTSQERNIKLNKFALNILNAYQESADGYIFPTKFDPAKDNSQPERHKEDISINVRNSFYNKKLKLACKWARIPQITFHTARHLLGDAAINAGVDMRSLQQIFGHKTITTTEAYAKSLYSNMSDDALDKAHDMIPHIKLPMRKLNKSA